MDQTIFLKPRNRSGYDGLDDCATTSVFHCNACTSLPQSAIAIFGIHVHVCDDMFSVCVCVPVTETDRDVRSAVRCSQTCTECHADWETLLGDLLQGWLLWTGT